MAKFTESHVEDATLEWLAGLGYGVLHGPDISPDGAAPERVGYDDVILLVRLRTALERLNPHLPAETLDEVLRKVQQTETPSLIEENRRLHRFMTQGVPVEVAREDGSIGGDNAHLIDFANPDRNDWLAVNQYTVIEGRNNRRPDVVLFINGLPVAVIELKNPGNENATLEGAFNQLQTYKNQIPSLFRTNAVLVTSDGVRARIGSLTANLERFMPWRTVDGAQIAPKGAPELGTMIAGVFEKTRFLDLIRDFTVFGDRGAGLVKIVAGYHQFHAVKRAVGSTLRAMPPPIDGMREDPARFDLPGVRDAPRGNRKVGVIWHTQGSGKSLLMAFYAGQIIAHPAMENPTLVIITDRNDLDDQLFGTFSMCRDLIRQTPQQAENRDDLRKVLTRPSGGVIFTTIQKFSPEAGETDYPVLTDRRNVIVIADEAHRSQYGFRAKVARDTGEVSYGFAKYLRDALPNASFIGFTGTPIEKDDVNTPAVFGDYIDVYDINRGVEDGATVPIYYESRLARIELDEDVAPLIDDEVAELTEDEALGEQEKLKRKWANIEAVVGAEKRLAMVARDLVRHYEDRALDLANRPDGWIRKEMGVGGLRTVRELRGEDCIGFESLPKPKQTTLVSRSFGHTVTDLDDLINAITVFASTAAEDIRKAKLVSSTASVFIETNRFSKGPRYTPSRSVELSPVTNNTRHIVRAAVQGLKEIYREGFAYKKAGVMLLDLVDADHAPPSLFDHPDPKDGKLIEAFDRINHQLGAGSINFGTAGQPSGWRSNSARRSPRYTTEWKGIPVVKA